MGYLTTHVLDTAQGHPGSGIRIELSRRNGQEWTVVNEAVTNDDGRVDSPLLDGDDFTQGNYQLVFYAADYFRNSGIELTEPAFLDDVVIRFGVAHADQHYHVPLLISPYSYSTYRGS